MIRSISAVGVALQIAEQIDGSGHRRVLEPGAVVEGTWTPTDIKSEAPEVQEAAAKVWTVEAVAAFRAEREQRAATDGPPRTRDQVDADKLAANLTDGTVDKALAEVLFGIIKGTISVPQPNLTQAQFRQMLRQRMRG